MFDELRKTGIIGFVQENSEQGEEAVDVMALEEQFHMNSWAAWVPLVLGGGALAIAALVLWGKEKKGLASLCALGVIGSGVGSYLWFSSAEQSADARDQYVVAKLAEGGVTFEGFQDEDTERIRVSRMVDGKKCSATFNVVLGDYEDKWPLRRGTGRYASDGCGINDVEDTSGLRGSEEEGLEGARSFYLDKIFAPVK